MDQLDPRTLRRHNARHAAILMRYDVLGEERKAIADDLNISLRQFERERRAAMIQFADRLTSLRESPHIESIRSNLAEIERDRAAKLGDCGAHTSALKLLLDVAKNASDEVQRCRAMLEAAGIEALEYEIESAFSLLRDAEHYIRQAILDPTLMRDLKTSLNATLMRVKAAATGPCSAAPMLEPLMSLAATNSSIDSLLIFAENALISGSAAASAPFLSRARQLTDRVGRIDPALKIDLLAMEGQLAFWQHNDEVSMLRCIEKAIEVARSNGYAGRLASLKYLEFASRWTACEDQHARNQSRAYISKLDATEGIPKAFLFGIYHMCADTEAAAGDPWRAIGAGKRALDLACSTFDRMHMKSLLCKALARAGRFPAAERLALEILSESHDKASGRATLNAKIALGDVAMANGDHRSAREHLIDAEGLARLYGSARIVFTTHQKLTALAHKLRVPRAQPIVNSRTVASIGRN